MNENQAPETNLGSVDNDLKTTDELTNIPSLNGPSDEVLNENSGEPKPEEPCPLPKEESEWEDLLGSGSLMKKLVKEGKPHSRPQRSQMCKINYHCTLEDGKLVEKCDDFEFQLGDCEVVQGLDVAIGLMNVGEKCKLKIEPRLAFGSKGLDSLVPPDCSVLYEVELLSVDSEIDAESLNITQRKIYGNKKRERGNWWYGRGENQLAIQCYRRALDFLDEVEGGIRDPQPEGQEELSDALLQVILENRISVYNNMAAAQIKMDLHEAALQSLQTVLRCQPSNVKALFRKAKVLRHKNDLMSSLKCLQKADEASPNNADIQKEMGALNALIQKQKVSERELARRMFNSGPKPIKRLKESSNQLFVWATLGASLAVGLVGFAAYRFKFM